MVSMGLLALVLFGLLAYFSIPVSLFPDMSLPYVTVQTVYAGASPQIIETEITKKIEDQVGSISQLDSIRSYSMDSVSLVIVGFKFGKDENQAVQEVKDKVDAIGSNLPSGADLPVISKADLATSMPVMSIIVQGDLSPTDLRTFAGTTVRDRLSQVAGVSNVSLSGGEQREIRVELDRSTIYARSIPITQISGVLAAANAEIPGGSLSYAGRDIPVRLDGNFTDLDTIRNLDVRTPTGVFKLRQLADVRDSHKDVRERTLFFDRKSGQRNDNAILIQIIKNPSANTIDVVDQVKKQIPEIQAISGGHVQLQVIKEDATFVRDAVNDTLSNVYLGILFTGLVLLFFLHDIRSTLIVALAMPFSIVATFLVMKVMGVGFNVVSLMGLSSATGTLVTNSVVVLENIFRYKEMGHSRVDSASSGAKKVFIAVFASTLTNIAVFVPLANMSGIMGMVLSNFAYTIVIATVFSILISFTLTPLMASRILPEQVKREGRLSLSLEAMFKKWEEVYRRMLGAVLRNKRRSLAVAGIAVAAFAGSMVLFSSVKFELMAATDGGKIQVNVELPQGNDLQATADVLSAIEKRLTAYTEVASLQTTLGSLGQLDQDVSVAQMNVFLVPRKQRSMSNTVIAAKMIRTLSDIPGARIRVTPVSEIEAGSSSSGIDLYLKGSDNAVLQRLAQQVQSRMNGIPGVVNSDLSSKSGKMELVFTPNRKQLSEDGLSVQAIAVTLRAAVDGIVATTYKEGEREYDVRVVFKRSSVRNIEDVRNIPVVSTAGVYPLSRYADVKFADGSSKIMRTDKTRTVEITADLLPGYAAGNVTPRVMAAVADITFPPGYSLSTAGNAKMLDETVRDLLIVFVIAVVLVYMLLAATLESLTQPLFILSTVPLSLIGVVLITVATGITLNVLAMLGIIMLVGVVVNNAILILDYYNQLRKEGMAAHDALLEACPTKLKPILMSNIAIILGMLPMALGIGASGAEMRQPMGLVIIGGIVSATILTLILIPALEYLVSRRTTKTETAEEA